MNSLILSMYLCVNVFDQVDNIARPSEYDKALRAKEAARENSVVSALYVLSRSLSLFFFLSLLYINVFLHLFERR